MAARRAGAAAIALCLSLACGRSGSKPTPPAAGESGTPVAAAVNGHIDPNPYRAQIEATEELLYSDAPLTDERWRSLSRNLLELHNAIVFRDTSEPARETSRKLFFLSARVDAEPAERRDQDELVVMRGVWEKIRSDQFASADWFRASATP